MSAAAPTVIDPVDIMKEIETNSAKFEKKKQPGHGSLKKQLLLFVLVMFLLIFIAGNALIFVSASYIVSMAQRMDEVYELLDSCRRSGSH